MNRKLALVMFISCTCILKGYTVLVPGQGLGNGNKL